MKQYDKGYLDGQLDSAENELYFLYEIQKQMGSQAHMGDAITIRIQDTEKLLKDNGREIEF
ncbi:hypothetical protein CVD19_00685 [Bacillus sp. T33-2]|nr:hypothetical protein CVD19_00685 [Bacillus sp. T33-2]